MNNARLFLLCCLVSSPLLAQNQITGGTCSTSLMSGTYSLVLNGTRVGSAAATVAQTFEGLGTAKFDGLGGVTITGTANTNLATATPFTFTGTYSVPSNCYGSLTISTPSAGAFTLLEYNGGKNFILAGQDANFVYSGSGDIPPAACANSTLSGEYAFSSSGFGLSGTAETTNAAESGVLQFDGAGNVTSIETLSSFGSPFQYNRTGTYSVTANCLGTATLADGPGPTNTLNFSITGAYGQSIRMIQSDAQFFRSGTAHSTFLNPSQAIGNVSSYAVNSTPPGSVFALFGSNLATRAAGASSTTLPAKLLTTSVTVNGVPAPLFYVDPGQIDAQMPWEIPAGTVATVVVTNGTSISNAVAVTIPATGTPGISVYANNHAVIVNQNGSTNGPSAAAAVGDEVVVYFTGGGPVQASGKLTTGAPAPAGLSPLSENSTITVGTAQASVAYIGLTPGSIGLYQANFFVPQLGKGSYPVVINIGGQASNNPAITISN